MARSIKVHDATVALFQGIPIELSIKNETYVEHLPVAAILDDSMIQFVIPLTSPNYLNLKKSRLRVMFRLTKADGKPVKDTPAAEADKVAMVNLGLHSLFRQVEVTLNSITVSNDVGCHYPYKSMLDVLLFYGHDTKESLLQGEMYYKDIGAAMEGLPT
jgi:hypothetical protein